MDMKQSAELIRTREAAAIMGISPRTLNGWRKNAFGPQSIRLRNRFVYQRAEVSRWLNDRRVTTGVQATGDADANRR